jgi:hypothetical protein
MIVKPAPSIADRLGEGSSRTRSGETIRRWSQPDCQPVEVADHAVGRDPGVEQQAPAAGLHHRREPVLGPEEVEILLLLRELGRQDGQRAGRAVEPPPPHESLVGQQRVRRVVHQGRDVHAVDRREADLLHPRSLRLRLAPRSPTFSLESSRVKKDLEEIVVDALTSIRNGFQTCR